MENPRPEKVAVVTEVRERLDQASAAILTEYRGLTVKDLATLRRSLREAGGEYRIYKNTLVRFAARDLGLSDLEQLLTGPTAIAFVDGDAVGVAKALRDYARTNPHLVVKGGVLGTKVITAADTTALADLPPREVVLARLAGALAAPLQQFAGLLAAVPRNFAYGLKALIDQGGATAEALNGQSPTEPATETASAPDEAPEAASEAATEPAATEPAATEPAATQPAATEPAIGTPPAD
jgi:large subunit ribosomal protein L10